MIALFILFIFNLCYALNVALINQQSYTLIDHMKRIEDFPEALEGKRVKDWIREDELPKVKNKEYKKGYHTSLLKPSFKAFSTQPKHMV